MPQGLLVLVEQGVLDFELLLQLALYLRLHRVFNLLELGVLLGLGLGAGCSSAGFKVALEFLVVLLALLLLLAVDVELGLLVVGEHLLELLLAACGFESVLEIRQFVELLAL